MNTKTDFVHVEEERQAIAVIGMSARFPKANNLNEYWKNLEQEKDCISTFSNDELKQAGIAEELLTNPRYVKARGILNDIERFDANFFGLTPFEASIMEPQQRIFLELCWEALETAGYINSKNRLISVYAGMSDSTYLHEHLLKNTELAKTSNYYQMILATSQHFLTTKVSYLLNLTGSSMVVSSACSTSLVAIIKACQSLINYDCDLALAGGISVRIPQLKGYIYQEGGIHSHDGKCRAFDQKASGTVSSNGGGVVVLKRLNEALHDRDTIDAVIKGFALNNDGADKVGYTAPSITEQARCIATALSYVDADSISYIETHGTGTKLGDPVEIAALTKAFRHYTHKTNYCAIGSVKTNIGHTDVASGVAGFIKTVLALKHKILPASLHFEAPNSELGLEGSPFYVNTKTKAWETDTVRRAGVSSFGIGGTNAHLILEESLSLAAEQSIEAEHYIIPLSAHSESALKRQELHLLQYLESTAQDSISLANLAYTLQLGRKTFDFRRAYVCKNRNHLVELLCNREVNGLKDTLANQWLIDGKVDWSNALYHNRIMQKIPLPTYPFDKQVCWINPSPDNKTGDAKNSPTVYEPYWESRPLLNTDNHAIAESNYLIFSDKFGFSQKITQQLRELRKNIIEVVFEDSFKQISEMTYQINPYNKEDYQTLFEHIVNNRQLPDRVIYCSGLIKPNFSERLPFHAVEQTAFIGLLFFAQIFLNNSRNESLPINIVSNHVARILIEDVIFPEQALLSGLSLVIPQEFQALCSIIDLGISDACLLDDRTMALLSEEIIAKPDTPLVAYRNGMRLIRQFKPHHQTHDSKLNQHIKKGGVYLITGGLGKIGIELASFLASNYQAHLILTTRSASPYEQILQKYEEPSEEQETLSPLIKRLLSIKKQAYSLQILQADVSNYQSMEQLFNNIEQMHHKIDGLFHLAAIVDYSTRVLIKDLNIDILNEQWLAKINGTEIISELIRNKKSIDFCLLFSSIASVIGGVGLCAYSAANNYLNHFCEKNSFAKHNGQTKWFSLSWDAWTKQNYSLSDLKDNVFSLEENAITPKKGMQIIQRYFNKMALPNLIISSDNNFDLRCQTVVNKPIIKKHYPSYPIIETTINQSTKEDEIQATIKRLFVQCLGTSNISLETDFYDLGGDSLTAISLLELIEEECKIRITLSDFMANQSIASLAALIKNKKPIESSFVINLNKTLDIKQPLFFIHPIGGSIFCYLNLSKHLSMYPFYAVQDPGLNDPQQHKFNSLEELALTYLQEIQRIQPDGSYILGGYSFGATVAFEIARQLLVKKNSVSNILLIDGWAAFSPELHNKKRFHQVMERTLENFKEGFSDPLLIETINKKSLLELLWQRMQLLLEYKPSAIPANLTLFKAKETLEEYQSIEHANNHWHYLTNRKIETYLIDGNHETILQPPGVQKIASIIRKILVENLNENKNLQ